MGNFKEMVKRVVQGPFYEGPPRSKSYPNLNDNKSLEEILAYRGKSKRIQGDPNFKPIPPLKNYKPTNG